MSDQNKKEIPSWQQVPEPTQETTTSKSTETPHGADASTQSSHAELLAQAREFLDEESVRSASRDKKVTFLEKKGLSTEDIQTLLGPESSAGQETQEIKTVHDSNIEPAGQHESKSSTQPTDVQTDIAPSVPSKRDVPPIITYPEFLLKPEKPPPLVTFQRLAYSAYALAGASALTYAASKYLVEPMIQSLTEARHDLATTTVHDLEKLNVKLESSVSHVPYIASSAVQKKLHQDEDDNDSIDSDPTELFHRDIATQTSPKLSRSSSASSLNKLSSQNAIDHQTSTLTSLHSTLQSLVSSLDTTQYPFAPAQPSKQLQETVTQFQAVLDKIENTYNPFKSDYGNVFSSVPDSKKNSSSSKTESNEATKFKAEIRALKGAFLSSRNFPTARPGSNRNQPTR